jgi:hypothetical protein
MQKYNAGLTAFDTFEKLFKNAEYFLHKTKKKTLTREDQRLLYKQFNNFNG